MEAFLSDMLADLILAIVASLLTVPILHWITGLSYRQSVLVVLFLVLIGSIAVALLKAKSLDERERRADAPIPTPPPITSPTPPVYYQGTLDNLIDRSKTSPEVENFLATLGQEEECPSRETNCLSFRHKGLEVIFDANDKLAKLVAFSNRVSGYEAYNGPLPLPQGLSIEFPQEVVHEMLSSLHHPDCNERRWCKYKLPQYLIDLEYEDGEILRISIVRPEFHPSEQISATGG